ncbi:MAG: hypothetical protein ABIH86_03305 [Planctomycetota bacterium]
MTDDERRDQIPDGIPDDFDPEDSTTWGLPGPAAKRRVIRANFKALNSQKHRQSAAPDEDGLNDDSAVVEDDINEPESPTADAYPEGWMYDDATHDIGSGRYRPLYVLFAGAAVAGMLPIIPSVETTPMLIFASGLIVWRLVAAFREIERTPDGNQASYRERISRIEWGLIGAAGLGAMIIGWFHGIGAFLLLFGIAASYAFWRRVEAWSIRTLVIGLGIISLLIASLFT